MLCSVYTKYMNSLKVVLGAGGGRQVKVAMGLGRNGQSRVLFVTPYTKFIGNHVRSTNVS